MGSRTATLWYYSFVINRNKPICFVCNRIIGNLRYSVPRPYDYFNDRVRASAKLDRGRHKENQGVYLAQFFEDYSHRVVFANSEREILPGAFAEERVAGNWLPEVDPRVYSS